MDFKFTPEQEAFRKEVRAFLKSEVTDELVEEVNSGLGLGPAGWEYVRKLGKRGWLVPMIPKEYGGLGASFWERFILNEEIYYCFPEFIQYFGANIVAPIVMEIGTEEQKKEYIPRIARGEIEFALGYTEPQAGSDLASIDIRAVEQDDCYIVNGQKTYNTACHYAQYHWLNARTSTEGKKYKGLSFFIVPLDSPGITINPMWTMGGERTNEVFYDNVKVPKKNLVGQKNRGFYHMMDALDHERMFPITHIQRGLDDLIKYVKGTERNGKLLIEDPLIRQKLAQFAIDIEVGRGMGYRIVWLQDHSKPGGHETSILKVFVTELERRLTYTAVHIMGQQGALRYQSYCSSPIAGWLEHWFLADTRRTISAGSSEIQRNIIAQRGLGLPRS